MGDRVIFEHYRVLQRDDGSLWELGSGAMGVTYKALDTDLQCPVALKVINADRMADEVNRNRFLREARVAAGLRHSNVASVYHLAKGGEQFFYAMEFIDGETTEANVARFGPMSLRPALRIAWQVSKALAAAARQQLVHRDIKPANIMIVADSEEGDWPFVKLIDFGLVRSVLRGCDSVSATRSGFLGTAQFASPEQIEESEVDGRSDIYSLGCTLWFLLTGEAPFTGSLASVFAQHLGSEPPWEKLRPFPKRVRRLLGWMLQKEPSLRPASAVELRREIERCLDDVERQEIFASKIARPFNFSRRWLGASPRSRGALICGVSVIGLMLALGYNGSSDRSPSPAPSGLTNSFGPAQVSTEPNEWFPEKAWSDLGYWDESFRSLAMTRRESFAGTAAPHPGVIGPKGWVPRDSIWDTGVAESFGVRNGIRSGEGVPFSKTMALNDSVDNSESKEVAIRKAHTRDRNEVKKATKHSVKKPQRRASNRNRDRRFNPLQELQRARENIRKVIRRML